VRIFLLPIQKIVCIEDAGQCERNFIDA